MIPSFPIFKNLELSDRAEIYKLTQDLPPYSDVNFVSLWSWNFNSDILISQLGEVLVVKMPYYTNQENCLFFLAPKGTKVKVEPVIAMAIKEKLVMRLVPEVSLSSINKINGVEALEDRDNFDYIFSTKELSEAVGSQFETLRNMINRFKKKNPSLRFELLDMSSPIIRKKMLQLGKKWSDDHAVGEDAYGEEESLKQHLAWAETFFLLAFGVYVNDELVAFGTNELLERGFAMAHYRKADKSYPGIYQFLEQGIAQELWKRGAAYLNYEQDLGIISLRHAKLSYRPISFLKKFSLILPNNMSQDIVVNSSNETRIVRNILFTFFFALSLWWLSMNARGLKEGIENNYFTLIYPLVSLFGGVIGILYAKRWGGIKSYFGRSILFFSLGLLAQFIGQAVYAWFIYVKGVAVPYPSIGDVGYYGSVWLYILGVFELSKVLVAKHYKFKPLYIVLSYGAPTLMVVFAYVVFLRGYDLTSVPSLTAFLDFAYPLTQAVYVAMAMVTYFGSRNILGGHMRGPAVLLLFSLIIQYVADFMFLFESRAGTWYVGGLNDYLYLLSYCAMAFALIKVNEVYKLVSHNAS